MYFCTECNNSFDITKSTSNITKIILKTPEEIIEKLKSNKDLNDFVSNINKETLFKNKKISKLSDDDKKKLNVLFETANNFERIEFKCMNCNFRKEINNSIKLYEINKEEDNMYTYESNNKNKLLFNNPIYPRTRDYTCKNINCITHKDSKNKEAVFYKNKQTNLLVYICGVCFSNWG